MPKASKPRCPLCGFDFRRTRRRAAFPETPLTPEWASEAGFGQLRTPVTLHDADCPDCEYRIEWYDLDANRHKLPQALHAHMTAKKECDDREFLAWLKTTKRVESDADKRERLRRSYNSAHVRFMLDPARMGRGTSLPLLRVAVTLNRQKDILDAIGNPCCWRTLSRMKKMQGYPIVHHGRHGHPTVDRDELRAWWRTIKLA